MGTILQVLAGLSVVGAIALAYLASKTSRVYNVVLLVLVFISALPFVYLAARTLKTINSWRAAVNRMEKEVADLDDKIAAVSDGKETADPAAMSIRQLTHELSRITLARGAVWDNVALSSVKNTDEQAGPAEVTVAIDNPEPHGLVPKMIVFAFDPEKYQGEFVVAKADKGKTVELAPNLPLDATELRYLAISKSPWRLYQMMPTDDAQLLADMPADQREKLLPKDLLATFADPARKLRNYQYIFHFNAQERGLLAAQIAKTGDNIPRIEAALAKVRSEVEFREGEKSDFEADLKGFQREAEAVTGYAKQLAQQVATTRSALRAVYLQTKEQAAEVVEAQLKAAERINLRVDGEQASAAR